MFLKSYFFRNLLYCILSMFLLTNFLTNFPLKAEIKTFLYSEQLETGVIKAGVKGAQRYVVTRYGEMGVGSGYDDTGEEIKYPWIAKF